MFRVSVPVHMIGGLYVTSRGGNNSSHVMFVCMTKAVEVLRSRSFMSQPYSRRQNKVSVPFALHGERSENGDIMVEKTVSKTVVKRYLNGAKTVTRKTEAVQILRDRTCCPRGSRFSMHVEDGGALGKR